MNNLLKRIYLMMLAVLVIIPAAAQQQPEWQSQYAVGLNKLQPCKRGHLHLI